MPHQLIGYHLIDRCLSGPVYFQLSIDIQQLVAETLQAVRIAAEHTGNLVSLLGALDQLAAVILGEGAELVDRDLIAVHFRHRALAFQNILVQNAICDRTDHQQDHDDRADRDPFDLLLFTVHPVQVFLGEGGRFFGRIIRHILPR